MNIEEVVRFNPSLSRLSESILSDIISRKYNSSYDRNLTWQEMGIDDELDQIELIIEIEKLCNIQLTDDVIYTIFNLNSKPIDFIRHLRENKLNDLGI